MEIEEIPSIAPYSGDMPNRQIQNRDTFADNIYLYISWAGVAFVNAFNLAVEKINLAIGGINGMLNEVKGLKSNTEELKNDVIAIKDEIEDLKNLATSVMGSTYGGEWNDTDDFAGKFIIYNNTAFASVSSPNVGEEPSVANVDHWIPLGSTINYVDVKNDKRAIAGEYLLVDTTSGDITITLPASPGIGEKITINDVKDSFEENSCIVLRNGNTIMQLDEDWTLDKRSIEVEFVFISNDWRIV